MLRRTRWKQLRWMVIAILAVAALSIFKTSFSATWSISNLSSSNPRVNHGTKHDSDRARHANNQAERPTEASMLFGSPYQPGRRLLSDDEESEELSNYPRDLFSKNDRKNGAFFFHLLGACYTFCALAIVCDEFFVPSLEVITEKLNLSDDVAGATFLAAGGSAPELATSFVGTFISHSDVGFGTIVGSAVFNILFVIAACAWFSSVELVLTWWPLFRDTCYYSTSLGVLVFVFYDHVIEVWEAAIMFSLYILYVVIMSFNEQLEVAFKSMLRNLCCLEQNKVKTIKQKENEKLSSSKVEREEEEQVIDINNSQCKLKEKDEAKFKVGGGDNIFKTNKNDTEGEGGDSLSILTTGGTAGLGVAGPSKSATEISGGGGQPSEPNLISADKKPTRKHTGHLPSLTHGDRQRMNPSITLPGQSLDSAYSPQPTPKSPEAHQPNQTLLKKDRNQEDKLLPSGIESQLPTTESTGSSCDKKLTPRAWDTSAGGARTGAGGFGDGGNYAKEGEEADRLDGRDGMGDKDDDTKAKNIAGNCKNHDDDSGSEEDEPMDLSWPDSRSERVLHAILLPLKLSLWLTVPDVRRPERRKFYVIAFLLSVIWIGTYSFFMVWWITVVGDSLGVPSSVMGLTVLAIGTSVPDLLESIIVAKQGKGDMAVSSSLGSNIFDVTVGLPLPWLLYCLLYGTSITVGTDGLFISVVMLFGMLLSCIAVIAIMRWRMSKKLAIMFLILWLVFLTASLLSEYLAS